MAGFTDALDVLGGQSEPLRLTVNPKPSSVPSEKKTDFSGALGVLSAEGQKPIGAGAAFKTGLKSGITANFSDELAGASAAGKTMIPEGLRNLISENGEAKLSPLGEIVSTAAGAMRLGYEAIAGRGAGTDAYEKARDAERQTQQQAEEQHPAASAAGNITGALAIPVGGMARATTMAGRMAAGGALGSGFGAAYGAGEGQNLPDRATRAGVGAVVGGVSGAVAPPILAGVGRAAGVIGNSVGRVLGHPIQTVRAGLNTDEEAARRIGTNLIADVDSGHAGMSAADLTAARANGQPTAVIDVGGENTRALARSAANTSPSGRAALEDMAGNRFAGQGERVSNFVRDLVPTPGNATRTAEAIDAAERAANKGGYAVAYRAGDRSINSTELQRLMGSPDVVSAMRDAVEKGKSRAIADGFGAFNAGVKVTDDGRVIFNKGKDGAPAYPNIQFWDYTYRNLRDKAQAAFRSGKNDEGSYLSSLSKQMRSELDNIVPEYGKARGVAASFFQAENALEAGQKFVTMRGPIEEARIAHDKMNTAQKALFAEGFVSDLADKVSKVSNNRSVIIDKIFNSPDGKARAELALGRGRAEELELFLRRENMMDLARTAIKGNSTTVRQLVEAGIAGGVGGAAGGAAEAAMKGRVDTQSIMTAALLGGAAAGHRAINFKVAQRVGEMLASDDPKVLRTALKMAKTNPDAGRAMRRAETILEKVIGQKANGAGSLLPSVAAGRADDQNQ